MAAAGCARPSAVGAARGVVRSSAPCPEADALFHQDPNWLGADAAYSVALGGGRVLWLFGDTFAATSQRRVREESTMVRNSVAIQTGLDPTAARMEFYMQTRGGRPASFFPEQDACWLWPLHGVRLVDGTLVLFLSLLESDPGPGLGFRCIGRRVAIVRAEEADAPPSQWRPRIVEPHGAPAGFTVGQSVWLDGDHVTALAVREPGNHDATLVRWRASDLARGELDLAEWKTTTPGGWTAQRELGTTPPQIVTTDAGPECSLHFEASLGGWLHVKSLGFGASPIVASTAPRPEGPWSAPTERFRPSECADGDLLVYAAKAHPELRAPAGTIWCTYAVNSLDFGRVVRDPKLYYPRFVRLALEK